MVDENEGREGEVSGIDVLGRVFREWWTGAGTALYGSASINELNQNMRKPPEKIQAAKIL